MHIAVAGGTGLVGGLTVEAARARGHEVTVLARATGVDLSTGRGAADALSGVDVVIDTLNVATMSKDVAIDFFTTTSRNLLEAESIAGVKHHVLLSIVGIDRVALPYYAGKLAQEQVVADGAVPFSILRATQFHEFAGQLLAASKGPIAVIPTMTSQPVAARAVATALVDLSEATPTGATTEIAGPRREKVTTMARRTLEHDGRRRLVVPLPVPGRLGSSLRGGGLVPQGAATIDDEPFDAWLAER